MQLCPFNKEILILWAGFSVWTFKLLSRAKVDWGLFDLFDPKNHSAVKEWHAKGSQNKDFFK